MRPFDHLSRNVRAVLQATFLRPFSPDDIVVTPVQIGISASVWIAVVLSMQAVISWPIGSIEPYAVVHLFGAVERQITLTFTSHI